MKREQAKLNKKQKKRKVREAESDSDSDGSVESVHIVERPKSATRKKNSQKTVTRQRRASSTDAKTDEEKAYQRKVTWLQDHGKPLEDEKLPESEDTSSDNWQTPVGHKNSNRKKYKELFVNESYSSTADLLRPKKKAKSERLSSVTIGYLSTRKGSKKKKHFECLRILLDSGCGATLINHSLVKKMEKTSDKKNKMDNKSWRL